MRIILEIDDKLVKETLKAGKVNMRKLRLKLFRSIQRAARKRLGTEPRRRIKE